MLINKTHNGQSSVTNNIYSIIQVAPFSKPVNNKILRPAYPQRLPPSAKVAITSIRFMVLTFQRALSFSNIRQKWAKIL